MIVGSCFENDPIWVQEIQHDLYWDRGLIIQDGKIADVFEVALMVMQTGFLMLRVII